MGSLSACLSSCLSGVPIFDWDETLFRLSGSELFGFLGPCVFEGVLSTLCTSIASFTPARENYLEADAADGTQWSWQSVYQIFLL